MTFLEREREREKRDRRDSVYIPGKRSLPREWRGEGAPRGMTGFPFQKERERETHAVYCWSESTVIRERDETLPEHLQGRHPPRQQRTPLRG